MKKKLSRVMQALAMLCMMMFWSPMNTWGDTLEDGYYYIINASSGFESFQHTQKAMFAFNAENVAWHNFDAGNPNYVWKISPQSGGGYAVQNLGTDTYISYGTGTKYVKMTPTMVTKQTITSVSGGYSITNSTNSNQFNTTDHGDGKNAGGRVIQGVQNGEANFSTWTIRKLTAAELNTAMLQKQLDRAYKAYSAATTNGADLLVNETQLSSNQGNPNNLGNLIDGNTSSFFETWTPTAGPDETHYIDIDMMGATVQEFYLKTTARYNGYTVNYCDRPAKINIYGSNDGQTWTLARVLYNLENAFPYDGKPTGEISSDEESAMVNEGVINLGVPYSVVRIEVPYTNTPWGLNCVTSYNNFNYFFSYSEMKMYTPTPVNAEAASTLMAEILKAQKAIFNGTATQADAVGLAESINQFNSKFSAAYMALKNYLQVLNDDVTDYQAKAGDGPGYYKEDAVFDYILIKEQAQQMIEAASSSDTEYESMLASLRQAYESLVIQPVTRGYYYITSAFAKFEQNQGVEKSLYPTNKYFLGWHTFDPNSFYDMWLINPLEDGKYTIQNAVTGTYINCATKENSYVRLTDEPESEQIITHLGEGCFVIGNVTNGKDVHPMDHTEGQGVTGRAIQWSNTRLPGNVSTWHITSVPEQKLQSALLSREIYKVQEILKESYTPTSQGLITAASQLSSNIEDADMAVLLDDNTTTFVSTRATSLEVPAYVDVQLPKAYSRLYVQTKARTNNPISFYGARPYKVTIYGSANGQDWTKVQIIDNIDNAYAFQYVGSNKELAVNTAEFGEQTATNTLPVITFSEPCKYLRYEVEHVNFCDNGETENRKSLTTAGLEWFELAGLQVFDVTTTSPNTDAPAALALELAKAYDALSTGTASASDVEALKSAMQNYYASYSEAYLALRTYLATFSLAPYEALEGDGPGQYSAALVNALRQAYNEAKDAVDASTLSNDEYASLLAALKQAVEAMKVNDIKDGYYHIISANGAFKAQQPDVTYAMSQGDNIFAWSALDRTDPGFTFRIEKNPNSNNYLVENISNYQTITRPYWSNRICPTSVATEDLYNFFIESIGEGQFLIKVCEKLGPMPGSGESDWGEELHPKEHGGGAGVEGQICLFSTKLPNSVSAWKLEVADTESYADAIAKYKTMRNLRKELKRGRDIYYSSFGTLPMLSFARQISCPYAATSDGTGTGNTGNMLDNDAETYFATSSTSAPEEEGYSMVVELGHSISSFYFTTTAAKVANNSDRPTKYTIYASNAPEEGWDPIESTTEIYTDPTNLNYTSDIFNLGDEYKYLKFVVNDVNTHASGKGTGINDFHWFKLAEMQIFDTSESQVTDKNALENTIGEDYYFMMIEYAEGLRTGSIDDALADGIDAEFAEMNDAAQQYLEDNDLTFIDKIKKSKESGSGITIVPTAGGVELSCDADRIVNVFTVDGRCIKSIKASAGKKYTLRLEAGMYVIARQKVMVR